MNAVGQWLGCGVEVGLEIVLLGLEVEGLEEEDSILLELLRPHGMVCLKRFSPLGVGLRNAAGS